MFGISQLSQVADFVMKRLIIQVRSRWRSPSDWYGTSHPSAELSLFHLSAQAVNVWRLIGLNEVL
jgi:hypothetical protein